MCVCVCVRRGGSRFKDPWLKEGFERPLPQCGDVVRSRGVVVVVVWVWSRFGKDPEKEAEKEEMWRRQQEVLAERRSGNREWVEKAAKRRQAATAKVRGKEAEKAEARKLLAQVWRALLTRAWKPVVPFRCWRWFYPGLLRPVD